MIAHAAELYRFRALIWTLVLRELRARYRGSLLGFLWSFLNPLLLMLVYVLVFSVYLRVPMHGYAVFLFSGLLPWLWFSSSLGHAAGVIVGSGALVKRILFPAEILPLVSVLSNMVNMLLSLPLLFAFLLVFGIRPGPTLLFLPVLLGLQLSLTAGLALALAALNVHLLDVEQILANVLVFLVNLAQGSSLTQVSGSLFEKGALFVPGGLDQGEWWRLITAAFLHASLIHLGMNMLVLWFVGTPVEQAVGRGRFLAIYIVSGLAGSAGAIIFSPNAVTVGASGAIFGILGAALVLEAQRSYVLGGQALGLIAVNLVLTFAIPNISVGGHVGGLIGGALSMLAFSRLGRTHGIYGRPGLLGIAGVIAVGVASVLVAYFRVQGLTA